MMCDWDGCGWQAIAASITGAYDQYVEHVIDEHSTEVEIDEEIPEGMVQVKLGPDDEWRLVTVEQAKRLHDEVHGP